MAAVSIWRVYFTVPAHPDSVSLGGASWIRYTFFALGATRAEAIKNVRAEWREDRPHDRPWTVIETKRRGLVSPYGYTYVSDPKGD